ncbi:hypothetical protein Ddye_028841 [Dipteronia dyeriana]|uniref:Reverse transcriptase zinc-binding domain-containing protein n=1 Tax=Dipteronia dyeriana TaxID=168575 RepID=A0AAD9WK25_9ROSI|nr:hypothetical protein Ddye_028841 [Dipteronia dyeriana]
MDVMAVLSIPTSVNRVDNSLCWHYTEDGNYSVKSSYKVGLRLENSSAPSSSNKVMLSSWWKFIWHLKIPPKVIMFLWKAYYHWLLTKVCLVGRHIPVDVVYPVCLCEPETVFHALWGCKVLKVVHIEYGFMNDLSCREGMHFQDFFFVL